MISIVGVYFASALLLLLLLVHCCSNIRNTIFNLFQMKFNEYFTVSYYLPEGVYQRHKEMAKYLRNSHFCKRGIHAKEAEHQFVRYIQQMKEYGAHLYSAVWVCVVSYEI